MPQRPSSRADLLAALFCGVALGLAVVVTAFNLGWRIPGTASYIGLIAWLAVTLVCVVVILVAFRQRTPPR